MRGTGIAAFSYFPLSFANPAQTNAMIDNLEAGINTQDKNGVLPPGLLEQLRHQISVLKNDNVPDLQLIGCPTFIPIASNDKFIYFIPS